MADSALSSEHIFGHVKDADYFHFPRAFPVGDDNGHVYLPQPLRLEEPIALVKIPGMEAVNNMVEPVDLKLTKFMVLEVAIAILAAVIFIRLAGKIANGGRPRGRWWNLLETFLLFIRNEVARPAIGHDADKFLPFLWTMFFFILGCNLMGMVPWLGAPSGSLAVTGVLALATFLTVIGAGMAKMGPIGFWIGQVPHMELPLALSILLKPMIFCIEIMGLLIKHFVLAVRLLANMFAGHIVLVVLIAFIGAVGGAVHQYYHPLFVGVSLASIFGATALSLLELFVAFLQAYIFTFLSALFIGMAVHPH